MDPTVPDLLRQGLIITVVGMTLVFAVLGLLWGIMALLTRVFRDAPKTEKSLSSDAGEAMRTGMLSVAETVETLTDERARVAAIVAGALMANATPLAQEAPAEIVFEPNRAAPIWVSSNRARTLQSWQPPRAAEAQQRIGSD